MKPYIAVFVCVMSLTLAAQQPPAPPRAPAQPAKPAAPPQAPPPPAADPELGGQPINIRLDVSVIDQMAQSAAEPKSVMVMLVDRAMGRTRAAFKDRSVAVDARPTILNDRIRVNVTIQSEQSRNPFLSAGSQPEPDPTLDWRNSFSLLLENGKPMLALETADAVTKRKMSIEVKATIQK